MALNHINIPVSDPVGMQTFLIKYLCMTAMRPGNDAMALCADENDMQLVLMGPKLSGETSPIFPQVFHFGFRQKTEEEVNQIYQTMIDDGLDIAPPHKVHGAWAFYYRSPWNVMIEVVA
jgi:lactoylglutathione lyase